MKQKELDHFKKQLTEDRTLLLQSLSPKMEASPKAGTPEGGDVCDIASSERERELTLRLSERDRQKLRAIEEALDRIKDGTFETCEECEAKIPIGRLRVMPFTTVCVECQSNKEKQYKLYAEPYEISYSREQATPDIVKEEEE